jgi:hypothetical protein
MAMDLVPMRRVTDRGVDNVRIEVLSMLEVVLASKLWSSE